MVEEVLEVRQRCDEARGRLESQRKARITTDLAVSQATARRKELEGKLEQLQTRTCASARTREEMRCLLDRSAVDAQLQAELAARLEQAICWREDRKCVERHGIEELARLEAEFQECRKPAGSDGLATSSELAALQLSCLKHGRELFASKVVSIDELLPLPAPRSRVSQAERCVNRSADLRRDWLCECASARVVRIGAASECAPTAADRLRSQLAQMQDLQMKFAEVRASFPLFATDSSPSAPSNESSEHPAVQLKINAPCPRWSSIPSQRPPVAVSFDELCSIHSMVI